METFKWRILCIYLKEILLHRSKQSIFLGKDNKESSVNKSECIQRVILRDLTNNNVDFYLFSFEFRSKYRSI